MVVSGDEVQEPLESDLMAVKGVNKGKQRIVPIKLKRAHGLPTRLAEALAPIFTQPTVRLFRCCPQKE